MIFGRNMFRGLAALCKQREQITPVTPSDQLSVNAKMKACVYFIRNGQALYEIW
jgi:hypothetical protein